MEQFNLDTWLKDKGRKVVTRDGRDVEIVKYNMKGTHFPVLYVISNEDGSQEPCECSKSGMCLFDNTQSSTDLFFEDEEEELTEFDYAVLSIISDHNSHTDSIEAFAKRSSKRLLTIARKEILKDLPKWKKSNDNLNLNTIVHHLNDDVLYWKGYYIWMKDLENLSKEE